MQHLRPLSFWCVKMKKKITIVLLFIAIAAVSMFMVLNLMNKPLDQSDDEICIVKVENGSGTAAIAEALKEAGVIDNTKAFRILSKIHGNDGKYMAGTYGVSPSMPVLDIQKMIVSNDTMANSFTVTEGQTVEKIARNLEAAGVTTYDAFMKEEEKGKFDYAFLKGSDKSMYRLEGYLYPDTYSFDVHTDVHKVIDTMLQNYVAHVDASSVSRKQLIIASIIEREAGNQEDMGKVSSVIYNRLDIGMALQMDSIISYVLQEDRVNLSNQDLQVDSSYNPYKNTGLPPGPICCPGEKAIEAALHPEKTDYLYFVLSDALDGTAKFTSDYDQFLKDKDAYYKAYNEKYGEEGK